MLDRIDLIIVNPVVIHIDFHLELVLLARLMLFGNIVSERVLAAEQGVDIV